MFEQEDEAAAMEAQLEKMQAELPIKIKLGILTLKNKKSAKDKDPIKGWVFKVTVSTNECMRLNTDE